MMQTEFTRIERTARNKAEESENAAPTETPNASDIAGFETALGSEGGAGSGSGSGSDSGSGQNLSTACRADEGAPPTNVQRPQSAAPGRSGAGGARESDDHERDESLNTLFSGRMPALPDTGAPAPVEAPPPENMNMADLETLVQRILVAEKIDGSQEVRLTISEGLIAQTDITISKDAEGMLLIAITSANAASFQTLVAARADLEQRFEALGLEARVHLNSGTGQEGNDTGRRSAGYTAYGAADEDETGRGQP